MRARTRSSLKFKGVLVLLFSIGSGFSWICVFLYFDRSINFRMGFLGAAYPSFLGVGFLVGL